MGCCCNPAQQHSLRDRSGASTCAHLDYCYLAGFLSSVWALHYCSYMSSGAKLDGLPTDRGVGTAGPATACTQPWNTHLKEHSICPPQLYKQQRTTAKSEYAVITHRVVVSFHEGLSGCAVSSYIYKTTFLVACQNYKILREGICRKVPASVIPPPGFRILGNNL